MYSVCRKQFTDFTQASQAMHTPETGDVEVTFTCESVREVAYECLRWSEHLTHISPGALRNSLREICVPIGKLIDADTDKPNRAEKDS